MSFLIPPFLSLERLEVVPNASFTVSDLNVYVFDTRFSAAKITS